MKKSIMVFLSTCAYIGYAPYCPGTVASLVAACIYILIPFQHYHHGSIILLGIIGLVSLLFVPIIKIAESELGHDSKHIVIDEVLGYGVSVLFLPYSIYTALYAFILFRIFDIAKPFPIRQSQSLPHGWGVIIDDIIAGIFSNIILQFLVRFFPTMF